MSLSVSVVLITYNRAGDLERCIAALFAQTHRPLEIVVVDDCSPDATPQVLLDLAQRAPPDVTFKVERHAGNAGIGQARNTGIRAGTGEIVAFIDDDCVADPGWVAGLVACFAEPAVAIAGGAIVEPPDRTWAQRAAEGINFLGTRAGEIPAVNGCNMAFRAGFLAEHPFDPSVRYGADELDLCFAAARHGRKVWFTPDARVTHYHRRTVRAFLSQQFKRGRGSVWVRRKHGRGLWPRKNWVIVALVLSAVAAAVLRTRLAKGVCLGALALFLLQILALDRSRGRSLGASLLTLPLVALGYLAEFLGALSALLRG
jgi:GT2 family glycosyltransferase